jgi:hypothetical protein
MAEEEGTEETAELDPVVTIQNTLSDLDPTAMCVGFVTVAEFLEEDGTRTLCTLHTDMAPWHMYGLITYAREHGCVQGFPMGAFVVDDEDEYE